MNVCAPVKTARYLSFAPGYDPLIVENLPSRALELCALVRGASMFQRQLYRTSYCPTSSTLTPVLVLVDSGLQSNCNSPEIVKDVGWSLEITALRTSVKNFWLRHCFGRQSRLNEWR